jgi:hypothetical protein
MSINRANYWTRKKASVAGGLEFIGILLVGRV